MPPRANDTSPESPLYRIGEISRRVAVKAFVLRYWETEFPMLRPAKSARGQRRYRPEDVELALEIKRLLYDEGFTIAGARKHLKENGAGGGGAPKAQREGKGQGRLEAGDAPPTKSGLKALREARDELRAILKLLDDE